MNNFSVLAMQSLVLNCQFSWKKPYEYENIVWLDERPCPTKEAWEAEKARLIAYQPKQECKSKAKTLISKSDWSVLPDRAAMLENASEFVAYRTALLQLILNPVENPEWPIEPTPRWKV